jgi:hypothetical protein
MDQRCLTGRGVANAARPPVGHRPVGPAPAAASRCNRLVARVAAPSPPADAQTQLTDHQAATPIARVPVCNDLNQHVREGHYEASLVEAQVGSCTSQSGLIFVPWPRLQLTGSVDPQTAA